MENFFNSSQSGREGIVGSSESKNSPEITIAEFAEKVHQDGKLIKT
jgi:hypothetical protein